MNLKSLKYQDIPAEIIAEGKKNRLIFPDKDNAHYFGGFIDDNIICLTCLVINKNKTASIKSNYTLKEHRGKGYFTELNKHCLAFARKIGVKSILLNCLEDSVKIHIKAGARVWKQTKHIYWMIYDKDSF
jgi:hypothetical protein